MLSIERAVSCAWPERYHNTGFAWHVLIVAETLAVCGCEIQSIVFSSSAHSSPRVSVAAL